MRNQFPGMASKFVPQAKEVCEKTLDKFISLLGSVDKLVVLSGAGISTESGKSCMQSSF